MKSEYADLFCSSKAQRQRLLAYVISHVISFYFLFSLRFTAGTAMTAQPPALHRGIVKQVII